MGRRKKSADGTKEPKKTPVKLRAIPRKHAGKITEPWAIMERLIEEVEEFHALKPATFVLLWRKDWKPDVDKVVTAAQIRRASEIDRTLAGYDLAMMLPETAWKGWEDTDKEWRIFHELCHVRPVLDTEDNQVRDEKDRLQWRLRKHPITAFPAEIDRYGLERVLGSSERMLKAVEDADRPLIAAMEQAGATGGSDPADWRKLPIDKLGLTESVLAKCGEKDVLTLGDFQEFQAKHGEFWAKQLGLKGNQAASVMDAWERFWAEHPEFCQETLSPAVQEAGRWR